MTGCDGLGPRLAIFFYVCDSKEVMPLRLGGVTKSPVAPTIAAENECSPCWETDLAV